MKEDKAYMHKSEVVVIVIPSKPNEGYEAVLPSQSGILRPDLTLRAESIRPHLSSHSLFFSLNSIFHGSSKASNLY